MWVASPHGGFYSAVAHRRDPETLIVRARVRADLVALAPLIDGTPKNEVLDGIYEDLTADYPYRLNLTRAQWAKAIVALADRIDYDNFKNAVKDNQGKERASVYMGVWTALLGLEKNHWRRRDDAMEARWRASHPDEDDGFFDSLFDPDDFPVREPDRTLLRALPAKKRRGRGRRGR